MSDIFILGEASSGKTCFSIYNYRDWKRIDIGDIVRSLYGEKRVWKNDIGEMILKRVEEEKEEKNVIIGIRELPLLKSLLNENSTIIWLDVPYEVRKVRFERRKEGKDLSLEYDDILKKDNELGLAEIKVFLRLNKEKLNIKIIKN